jgi:predicted 3-demethylubiquinone-9 3-methyltransferase (glyoxalase superfamily)
MTPITNPIYPCLWFDGQARSAAEFYCSVFQNSKILADTPMVVTFELDGKKFMGLNGGPMFKFNEAVSFVVECDTQEESESMCGWLKDKFGVSWQIVPTVLSKLMSDPVRSPRVMQVILQSRKLDIDKLKNA